METTVTTTSTTGDTLFLLVVGDSVHATEALPGAGTVTIGRAPESEIRIDDASISRTHAVLHLDAPLRIVDLESANGTWVADQRIPPQRPTEISVDQAVRLGSVTVIVQRRTRRVASARRVRTHAYFETRVEEECDRGRSFTIVHLIGDSSEIRTAIDARIQPDDVVAVYVPGELEVLLVSRGPESEDARGLEQALEAAGVPCGHAWYLRDGRDADAVLARARARAHGEVNAVEPGDIVVADPSMIALHRLIEQVAAADISVLLQGETGVGKEVFAEAIHRHSPRAAQPFIKLNCAAISDSLLEAELFGYEKGAFTGAAQAKPGLLELASGGSVFLDEIAELALGLQAKLLRVLDERKLLRVGGLSPRSIDVRVISASNRDLDVEVARGAFRQDLLYRLNAMSIIVPALRDRPAEIVPLAVQFLHLLASKYGRPVPRLTDAAAALLRAYAWPGNVRELRNVIERALVLTTGSTIDVRELPEDRMRAAPPVADQPVRSEPKLAPDERQRVLDALEACAGNQTHAATLLGISRRALVNKLDKLALPRPRKGRP